MINDEVGAFFESINGYSVEYKRFEVFTKSTERQLKWAKLFLTRQIFRKHHIIKKIILNSLLSNLRTEKNRFDCHFMHCFDELEKRNGKMSIHVFFSLSLINASSIVSYRLYSPPSYTSVISLLCGCFWLNFPAFHIAIHIEITICCRHFYRYVSFSFSFFWSDGVSLCVCASSSSFSCCIIKTKRCICSYL